MSVTVPPVSCPVNAEFTVNIGIRSGTAGKHMNLFSQPLCYLQSLQSLLVIIIQGCSYQNWSGPVSG